MLAGVPLEWHALFSISALEKVEAKLRADKDKLAPPAGLVFEAFRYCKPSKVSVVIIGQDPYPNVGEAQGLSFSVSSEAKLPTTLRNIYKCLEGSGLRVPRSDRSGDLRSWAVQGVLLLNMSFTTRVGERRAHASIWAPFIQEFIGEYCRSRQKAPLHFLLWGSDAAAVEPVAKKYGHITYKWTHPSPMSDNKLPEDRRFAKCPHFTAVNAALRLKGERAIQWDNQSPIIAFTDGACTGNGSPTAKAAYSAVVLGGSGPEIKKGIVKPVKYVFVRSEDPRAGIRATTEPIPPTNNRAEWLGLIAAMLAILRGRGVGDVEIVSDSLLALNTLKEWLPKRRLLGTADKLSNFDLVAIAEQLLNSVRAQCRQVTLTHVNSHQPRPSGTDPRALLLWRGNDRADREASRLLASK